MSLYAVKVQGLQAAREVPELLDRARRAFPERAAELLADDLRQKLPLGPPSDHVRDRVFGRVRQDVITVGTEGSAYAARLEDGATIVADKTRSTRTGRPPTLRFVIDGKVLYRRRIVISRNRPGGKPFTRALRGRARTVQRAFDETVGTVG